jgi:hypothetical protein
LGSQQEAESFVQDDVLIESSSISAAWSISAVPRKRPSFALQKNFAMCHFPTSGAYSRWTSIFRRDIITGVIRFD